MFSMELENGVPMMGMFMGRHVPAHIGRSVTPEAISHPYRNLVHTRSDLGPHEKLSASSWPLSRFHGAHARRIRPPTAARIPLNLTTQA